MKKLKYLGCTDEQYKWGQNDDPRETLEEGHVYDVDVVDVHSWHTRIKLIGIQGEFNSVCFEEVE